MIEPSDVVTVVKGKHILHFGGEFLAMQVNATNWGNVDAGATNFTGAYTENWTPPPAAIRAFPDRHARTQTRD